MSSYKVEFPQSEFKENDDGQGECDVFGGHDGHDSHGRHDPCQKKIMQKITTQSNFRQKCILALK